MLFDTLLFADYSGAASASSQRRAIRLARATKGKQVSLATTRFTRTQLTDEFLRELDAASRANQRVIFGQDHQYSLPLSLIHELGLPGSITWRALLRALVDGTYGGPKLSGPRSFAREFNEWLEGKGRPAYFYSATKSDLYGVPRINPRNAAELHRLTERHRSNALTGSPKALNRVGDNGTVGGQTLCGLIEIDRLLRLSEDAGMHVSVWPFDGLSIDLPPYTEGHIMIEPYPTAVRDKEIPQSDESDALACALVVQQADYAGELVRMLDLRALSALDAERVRLEGWIASHRLPLTR